MADAPAKRPPAAEGMSGEFYALAAKGKLHVQRCRGCSVFRHPPRYMCAECGSAEWEWAPVSGRGRIFSWTVTHNALDPAWQAEAPYASVIVTLEEGARIVGGLRGLEPGKLVFDLPVEVEIEPAGENSAFIYFVPDRAKS